LVFHGQILRGETAVKTHATDVAAFSAPHAAPAGCVDGGQVVFHGPPGRRDAAMRPPGLDARVALVSLVVGDDGMLLDLAAGLPTGRWIVADVSYSDADASTQLTEYEGTAPRRR